MWIRGNQCHLLARSCALYPCQLRRALKTKHGNSGKPAETLPCILGSIQAFQTHLTCLLSGGTVPPGGACDLFLNASIHQWASVDPVWFFLLDNCFRITQNLAAWQQECVISKCTACFSSGSINVAQVEWWQQRSLEVLVSENRGRCYPSSRERWPLKSSCVCCPTNFIKSKFSTELWVSVPSSLVSNWWLGAIVFLLNTGKRAWTFLPPLPCL